MPVLFVLFIILFVAAPYVLLFALLLLPRILPPIRRIPRKWYLLADAAISLVTVVILTLVSGKNPLEFTWEYLGWLLNGLYMLSPLFGFAILGALIVNITSLFKDVFSDDPNFRFNPKRTAIAATAAVMFYVSATVIHIATLEVQIPDEYVQYVDPEKLEADKRSLIKYGFSNLTYPLYIKVSRAGEYGYDIVAKYFLLSTGLGIGSDGMYSIPFM